MFPRKLTLNFASAPAATLTTAQKTEGAKSVGNEPMMAKTFFNDLLNARRIQARDTHKAVIERAAKTPSLSNTPHKQTPQSSADDNDAPAASSVDVPQKEQTDDPDTDTTTTAEHKETPGDQTNATENTPSNALTLVTPPPTAPTPTAEAVAQTPAQTALPANNAEQSEAAASLPMIPNAKPGANTETAKAQEKTSPAEQVAAADAKDEKTSVSTPSQVAPELPPIPTAGGRKQAHENRDHAAHFKVMETDVSPETAAAPQTSPPPVEVGAGTALEASLNAAVANAAPMKDPSAKPTETGGTPLVFGETASSSKEARGAELAPAAQESPRTQSADTMDQIVLGLKGKLDARTGKAEIQLDPPNLGAMKVSVTLEDGLLTAEFQSPSPVVRELLQGNFEKLKTVLQGQGVTVDRLVVNAPADAGSSGQNPQASFGSATHDGRSAGQYYPDPRSNNGRSGEDFARLFNQAQDAPLDLVA